MRAVVFSTFRQVRDFIAAHDDTLLPKLYTMQEFMERCVVVPGRVFVDEASRVLYLYRAIEGLDIGRLGFEKSFLSFVKNSEFIFRFFEELHAEKVDIQSLRNADTYADFEDHLTLLATIKTRYDALLESEGLIDRTGVVEYRLAEGFLAGFDRIDIHVDGFLSRFELEVLERIRQPLYLHFATTPYNRKLIERLALPTPPPMHSDVTVAWKSREVTEATPVVPLDPEKIETAAFEERIDQVAFALKKVADFIAEGADPDRVAVVLPDEGFAEYLKLFDTFRNFNYAMGTPFTQSRYYRLLADLYDALSERSESAMEKMREHPVREAFAKVENFEGFLAFLDGLETTPGELKVIDEVRYRFADYGALLTHARPLQLLHTWLQRLENLHIDDTGGGRVTVMGVLESRGKRFDGVVVVDFNEEVVPRVGEKDLFLNSAIRRHAGMPTRSDKENLQKNYYYRLLQNSRRAALCWVKNEEMAPSRFLMELGFGEREPEGARYRPVIAPAVELPARYEEVPESPNPFLQEPSLTPTRLRDWLVCPRRYYYRYRLMVREAEETGPKVLGTLIHEALEAAILAKERFAEAQDYFAFVMDHLHRHASGALQRFDIALEWEPRIERFCREDFETLQRSRQQVERWCEVEFEGFRLRAKVDRIDETGHSVRLIDYKTSAHVEKNLRDENDFQLLFYTLWAEATYPRIRVDACYYDLYQNRTLHRDIGEERQRLRTLLQELRTAPTLAYPMTGDLSACRYCLYKTACGRG